MASITSLTGSSSTSSIYGTRNVLSGLASGMDTEAMIENAVSGYNTKIAQLQQKQTKVEWQQTAYRSIIGKIASFSDKYTSYTSSTNLMSASFFNSAVKVNSQGEYAKCVAASGRTGSDVKLLGVKQLAKSATYVVSGLGTNSNANGLPMIQGGEVDLSQTQEISKISGSLTLSYGNDRTMEIEFGELETYSTAEELKDAIVKKLGEQNMTLSDGTSVKASTRIDVSINTDGNIEFSDKVSNNTVSITGASGDIKDALGINPSDKSSVLNVAGKELKSSDATVGEYLSGKELSFTLNGVTKKITLDRESTTAESIVSDLQEKLNDAFGEGKIDLSESTTADNKLTLNFAVAKGSTLNVSGTAAKAFGLGENGSSTYANTGSTLGELLSDFDWKNTDTMAKAEGSVSSRKDSDGNSYMVDSKGNRVAEAVEGSGQYYRVDEDGNFYHEFKVNGKVVGAFTEKSALENVMTTLNSNTESGVSVSYSKTTNQFLFTATESGAAGKIEFDGLAAKLFGNPAESANYIEGQDAIFSVSVNGQTLENMTRSDNSFEIDGLTLNLKGTFNYTEATRIEYKTTESKGTLYEAAAEQEVTGASGNVMAKYLDEEGYYVNSNGIRYVQRDADGNPVLDENGNYKYYKGEFKMTEPGLVEDAAANAVTFETEADADTIVDAIKTMVEDYNAMVKEIKDAYSTLPLQNSSGKYYEPLTDEDRADMSDSAIEAYEEKAKTGLLFGDNDLSALYEKLRSAISMTGADGEALEDIGITTSYSNGLTTLNLNENKLRAALDSDPDKVSTIFTKSMESGSSTNGLMQALKTPLDMYGKITGTKGILVEKAGSSLAPTSLYQNVLQEQMDQISEQIEKWQDKLSDKVDYYTSKFTQLEQLISEMNSQSSTLFSLSGGY